MGQVVPDHLCQTHRRSHYLLRTFLHVQAAGDELPKAHLMSKGVTGPNGPLAATKLWVAMHPKITRTGLGLADPLMQPHSIDERRLDSGLVETEGHRGQDEYGAGEKHGQPCDRIGKHLKRTAHILVDNGL